ncbi:hypothetical protein K443DRAFT_15069 [Laccaria amethystina LaAM-08-1]|uniref:Uncharacterized protein n=1 Tax=Laccaria amethystina LaAM-08-1 TaxID=1095629 RepID=A0A0C9WLU5_9AGAR|nr:hypothetical protein K443DRAFT_15069 [Laccaria amethystina LaAM-08-1]
MSMPPDSHQILPVCSSGCTYRRLARNRGAGSYVLVLGSYMPAVLCTPTFTEVVLAGVLVNLAFGVVFTVFGVRSHSCSRLLAVNG